MTAPVPRFSAFEPVKVKSPFQFCGLLLDSVSEPPLVLLIVPPEIVKVPVPSAVALLMFNVPALNVVPPVNVFAPESVRAPAPALVSEKPEPEIAPPTVSVPPDTVT